MRLSSIDLMACLALLCPACGGATMSEGGDGAAHIGVVAELDQDPMVSIDDQLGTDVRVFVTMDHLGGPDAETLEVVSATLKLDLEPYADLALSIPAEHAQFPGLADGESFDFELRGALPDTHEDWGLCIGPDGEDVDELRLSLDLVLRVTPGANDGEDEFEFESRAVQLACTHTN